MNLRKAMELCDYEALKKERGRPGRRGAWSASASARGSRYPDSVRDGSERRYDCDEVRGVIVTAGGHSHGQGHITTFSQIVADELGVDVRKIAVSTGDSSMLPWSSITAGSSRGPSREAQFFSVRGR